MSEEWRDDAQEGKGQSSTQDEQELDVEPEALDEAQDLQQKIDEPNEQDAESIESLSTYEPNDEWPTLTFPEPQYASLVISADDHETRVAYLIDDVPTEFFFDRSQGVSLVSMRSWIW